MANSLMTFDLANEISSAMVAMRCEIAQRTATDKAKRKARYLEAVREREAAAPAEAAEILATVPHLLRSCICILLD